MMDEEKRSDGLDTDNPLAAFESVEAPKTASPKRRFSGNTRLLIAVTALVAVLAILVAVLLPLLGGNHTGSSTATSTPEQIYPLYDHAKDTAENKIVQSVAIQHKDDSYTVYYNTQDKAYRLKGYEDFVLADSVEQEFIAGATALNGYDLVKSVGKLADFGLEKPAATATITYHNGNTATLLLGNATPDAAGYYAKLQDSDTVYMVDSSTASLFLQKKGELVNTTILAAPTVKEDDENGGAVLKEFTLKGGPANQTLTIRQSEKSDGTEFSYANFVLIKPYFRKVTDTVSDTLDSFTSIIASDAAVLHPTAADKTAYGFNKPYATLDITLAVQSLVESEEASSSTEESPEVYYYNSIESTVTVGNKDANGNYYVMITGHNAIYRVMASMLSPLVECTYENTIDSLLFLKDIKEIGKFEVMANGKTHTLTITHDETKEERDDQLTVLYNGKKLSTADFRVLYSLTMGLQRYDQSAHSVNGTPKHRIALYLNNGSAYLSLDFFEKSASLYTVRTSEGELFTIKASSINNWLTQFDNFIAGKKVADI